MSDSSSFLHVSPERPEAAVVAIAAASVIKKAFLFEPVIDLIIIVSTPETRQ